ncbi:hypothetical protein U9M48_042054 [Paspalum notatum var. saurae]|uniref:RING-type E3 ubiquitin transferase n=1 Tax=Paspalum notatum var. saurae TaxID=547442 RepID=A0AAQ3XFU5_PASNO
MPIRPYSRRPGSAAPQIADWGWGRKRTRCSPPSPPPQDPEDDDSDDDDDDDDEEDDGESGSETESGSESDDSGESSDGSDDGDDDAEDQQEDGDGEQSQSQHGERGQPPLAQRNGGDDDHDKIIIGVARRRGSTAPPPPSSSSGSSSVSVIAEATVENTGALDCGICFLPLKPPIFQCNVGHVVCSPCYQKLGQQASKCHVCRAPTPGGYRRCHAMEQLLSSIRVPCPHAAHGCAARPAYHDRDGHARQCAHAPCHCPGEGCGFAGSTAALLDHAAAAHQWRCTTRKDNGTGFYIFLREGFNFVTAVRDSRAAAGGHGAAADKYLLLLNLERAPFCRVVTVFIVHPHCTGTATLKLSYRRHACSDMCNKHHQSSEFFVRCTDLSNGILPGAPPCKCCPFILPRCDREEKADSTMVLLAAAPGGSRCHVCRAPTAFRRCHAMEQLVDSIRVACPHAAHGCADRPAYHARERHARECAHAPYLFLLNVVSTAFGRAVSAAAAAALASSSAAPEARKAPTCELELKCSRYRYGPYYQRDHYQTSRFQVACTDGSNGLPDPNASFQFFIPKYVAGSESDKAAFHVTAGVYINS